MKRPHQYHPHFLNTRYVPPGIWIALAVFVGMAVVQTTWLWHRSQQVDTLQGQLQSLELLPSQGQRHAQPDPTMQQSYRELLDISTQLTLPVHIWMACLQPPAQVPVRITSFEWNAATAVIDMRMNVYHRTEFADYLQALAEQKYPCSASLRQEERTQEGGYQLSLRLYSLHKEAAGER